MVFGIRSCWFGISLWTREWDRSGSFTVSKISFHVSSRLLIPMLLRLQSLISAYLKPKRLAFCSATLGMGIEAQWFQGMQNK